MKKISLAHLIQGALGSLFLLPALYAETPAPPATPLPASAAPQVPGLPAPGESAPDAAAEEAPAEPAYVYKGDRYRDPFVPLTGQGGVWDYGGSGVDDEGFNPTIVELKGIIKTQTGRWALLRSNSGTNYLVKNGKVYDSKRKAAPGYVGIVKEKELVIIGPDNKTTEFKLKKDEEDGKKPK